MRKVGANLHSQLDRLFTDCGPSIGPTPFAGGINLGEMAKSRQRISSSNASIVDLAAAIPRHSLNNDNSLRRSNQCIQPSTDKTFAQLAALDAFASLAVYTSLKEDIEVGQPITSKASGGAPVTMFGRDGGAVAEGRMALDQPPQFQSVNVTNTRAVVIITKVLVPSYIMNGSLLPSKTQTPLSSLYTTTPFSLLCDVRHLRTRNPALVDPTPNPQDNPGVPVSSSNPPTTSTSASGSASSLPSDVTPAMPPSTSDDLASVLLDEIPAYQENEATPPGEAEPEVQAAAQEWATLIDKHLEALGIPKVVRSRVIGDAYHVMAMIKIPSTHGLRPAFSRALRDAICLTDADDRQAIEEAIARKGWTFD